MPRYRTRFGVEVETSEQAAQAIGYEPVEPAKKAPAKTASKSSDGK